MPTTFLISPPPEFIDLPTALHYRRCDNTQTYIQYLLFMYLQQKISNMVPVHISRMGFFLSFYYLWSINSKKNSFYRCESVNFISKRTYRHVMTTANTYVRCRPRRTCMYTVVGLLFLSCRACPREKLSARRIFTS